MGGDLSSDNEEDTTNLLEKRSDNSGEDKETLSAFKQNVMLVTILSLQCFSICADSLIFPFFPNVIMEKGLKDIYAGIVFSSYEFSRFLASPVAGSMLGIWHPKSMCAFGNIITATACIVFGTLYEVEDKYLFFVLCAVTRFIGGIGSAMLTVAATSILMKASSYKSSTIVALLEMMNGTGFALGPAIGAGLHMLAGYTPMFWIFGGMTYAFLPVFFAVVPKVEDSGRQRRSFLSLFTIPGCCLVLASCFITKVISATRTTGISDWMVTQYHKTPSFVGVMFGCWSASFVSGCVLTSQILKKGYIFELIISGYGIYIFPMMLIGPSPLLDFLFHGKRRVWQTILGMFICNFFSAFVLIPPLQAAIDLAYVNGYKRDSVQTYGMVAGFINCGLSLGSAVGPTVSGAVTDAFNFTWTVTGASLLSLLMGMSTLTYFTYMKYTNQPLAPETESDAYEQLEEDDTEKRSIDSPTQCVAKACEEKMDSCLNNYEGVTAIHQQQPAAVESQVFVE